MQDNRGSKSARAGSCAWNVQTEPLQTSVRGLLTLCAHPRHGDVQVLLILTRLKELPQLTASLLMLGCLARLTGL